jgi:hypothetical protein
VHVHVGVAGQQELAAAVDALAGAARRFTRRFDGRDASITQGYCRIEDRRAAVRHRQHRHVFENQWGGTLRGEECPATEGQKHGHSEWARHRKSPGVNGRGV